MASSVPAKGTPLRNSVPIHVERKVSKVGDPVKAAPASKVDRQVSTKSTTLRRAPRNAPGSARGRACRTIRSPSWRRNGVNPSGRSRLSSTSSARVGGCPRRPRYTMAPPVIWCSSTTKTSSRLRRRSSSLSTRSSDESGAERRPSPERPEAHGVSLPQGQTGDGGADGLESGFQVDARPARPPASWPGSILDCARRSAPPLAPDGPAFPGRGRWPSGPARRPRRGPRAVASARPPALAGNRRRGARPRPARARRRPRRPALRCARRGMLVRVGGVGQGPLQQGVITEPIAEPALEIRDASRVHDERARRQARYFLKASAALVPPKPKALLRATSTSCLRAWFGT